MARRRLVRLYPLYLVSLLGGCAADPDHEWYYFPEMQRDEVLCFKTYDSDEDPFHPTLHSSFLDPRTPPNAPVRKSLEVRVLCLLPRRSKI